MGGAAPERTDQERPIRVLESCQPADEGGVARHVGELSVGLAGRGFDVIVACPPGGALERFVEGEGVPFEPLPMGREIEPAKDLASFWHFYRLCRRLKPDVVHVHSSKAGFIGRVAAKLAGVPVVVFTPHCWSFQSVSGRKQEFYVRLERFASRFCDMTVAVSRAEKDEAIELGVLAPDAIRVIHNGISEEELQAPPADRVRDLDFIAVGRLAEQKGYPYLVEAMAYLVGWVPDATVTIVGGGPEEELREQAARLGVSDSIRFEGDRSDVRDYLLRARAFVTSALWEGLPYAIIEGMAAELPVAASNVGGNAEIVVDGQTGFVVEPRDAHALAVAMRRLAEDPDLRARFGDEGARRVRDTFRLDVCIQQVEQTYVECLRKDA